MLHNDVSTFSRPVEIGQVCGCPARSYAACADENATWRLQFLWSAHLSMGSALLLLTPELLISTLSGNFRSGVRAMQYARVERRRALHDREQVHQMTSANQDRMAGANKVVSVIAMTICNPDPQIDLYVSDRYSRRRERRIFMFDSCREMSTCTYLLASACRIWTPN